MKDKNHPMVAVNVDDDFFWYMYESNRCSTEHFEAVIRDYVKGYAGCGISDLLINCFCQVSVYPSESWDWLGEKYDQTVENSIPVDYRGNHHIKHIVEIYRTMKRDPLELLLEEIRGIGITPWLSVRMNDCHYSEDPTSYLHGKTFYESMKKGWFIGTDSCEPYYSRCYDYALDIVRERMLAYLAETMNRYDVDGLELDFMREIHCFNYVKNPDCHKIMTEFMKRVRELILAKSAERGHEIKLAVHLCGNLEDNKLLGFDVAEWIRLGLVDVVIPSSRWEATDSDMPMTDWRALADQGGVMLWAGLETLLMCPYSNTLETVKGFAAQYLDAGADQMYLYNFFRTRGADNELSQNERAAAGVDETYVWDMSSDLRDKNLRRIWSALSDYRKIHSGTRRNVMTFREGSITPVGKERFRPFPCKVEGKHTLSMQTGFCAGQKATLYVGLSKGDVLPRIEVDGAEAIYLGESVDCYMDRPNYRGTGYDGFTGYDANKNAVYHAYSIRTGIGLNRTICVEGRCTLRYLEMKIKEN